MQSETEIFNNHLNRNYLPRCVYCGKPATTVDHIVPRVHGGTDAPDNLAPACKTCNSSKNAKSVCEWTKHKIARHLRRNHRPIVRQLEPPAYKLPEYPWRQKLPKAIKKSADGLTFHQWIKAQVGRNDPIGDFAGDWAADRDRPGSNDPSAIFDYLHRISACKEAIAAFVNAWGEFSGEAIQEYEADEC